MLILPGHYLSIWANLKIPLMHIVIQTGNALAVIDGSVCSHYLKSSSRISVGGYTNSMSADFITNMRRLMSLAYIPSSKLRKRKFPGNATTSHSGTCSYRIALPMGYRVCDITDTHSCGLCELLKLPHQTPTSERTPSHSKQRPCLADSLERSTLRSIKVSHFAISTQLSYWRKHG